MLKINFVFDDNDLEIWFGTDGWYNCRFKYEKFLMLGSDRDKPINGEYIDYIISLGLLEIKNV